MRLLTLRQLLVTKQHFTKDWMVKGRSYQMKISYFVNADIMLHEVLVEAGLFY